MEEKGSAFRAILSEDEQANKRQKSSVGKSADEYTVQAITSNW